MVADELFAETEDMALNQKDKDWIAQQIKESVRGSNWWLILTGWVKRWSGFGALVAVIIFALLQWKQTLNSKFTRKID
jgi:hypothetical protein